MDRSVAPRLSCREISLTGYRFVNLKAEIWVKALIRRANSAQVPAMVVRRGHGEAGTIYVKVARLDGTADLYGPTWDETGGRIWMRNVGTGPAPESDVDAYLSRQEKFDPDFWVVELEDKEGRHFLTEPVREDQPSS